MMKSVLLCCVLMLAWLSVGRAAEPPAVKGTVRQIKVIADKAPDCSSLKSIVESVTRGCKTNDEKAIALYNFMQLTHYHQGYPSEKEGLGALREINVYGWSLCGGLHTVEAALWREMGWQWRYVGWSNPGHTTVEAFYDDRWHYLDVFLRYYTWMPNPKVPGTRTIAGEEDIRANPRLVTEGLEFDKSREVYYHRGNKFEVINDKANWRAPSFLSCGDTPDGIIQGIRSSSRAGSPTGWATLQFDSPGYATDVNLAPGSSLTLSWEAIEGAHWWNGRQYVPGHGCGDRDYRNCPSIGPILEPYQQSGGKRRSFSNGTLRVAADLSQSRFGSPEGLQEFAGSDNVKWSAEGLVPADAARPASITLRVQSPYVISRATGQAAGADSAEISFDQGKTWKQIKLENFSEDVGGNYDCLIRLSSKTALRSFALEATVQCNRGALPYLSPGKNVITVAAADPKDLGDNQLVITYAYYPGFRSKSYEALAEEGAEVARAHNATWAKELHVVQKTFKAGDLPAKFEIDIPTPAGKLPVYPRMAFVRREIVSTGSQSLPLSPTAVTPQPVAVENLLTLPNPFLVGTELPPVKPVRSTSQRRIELRGSHAVSLGGEVQPNHYLKWKEGETWVMLIGGEIKDLPKAKEIAEARLIVPVTHGHAKAATKIGVTLLKGPFQPGQAFDFKNLGEIIGTSVVPLQPNDTDYAPPKEFAIDLTRTIKQIASGEAKFTGLALRVIPDRSVDDGYLTRIDLPQTLEFRLELDVYNQVALTPDAIRAAVAKSLPLLEKGAKGSLEMRKQCFTCHNQGLPIQALTVAQHHGFQIDTKHLQEQLQHTAEFLERNREDYLQGKGQGGQVDTAGYALWALDNGGWKPDATTSAVAEYLLQFQSDRDYWRPQSRRPPTEQSYFTSSFLALRGLKVYGTAEQKERIDARFAKVRQWLVSTSAVDTEDRVFRLRALRLAGATEDDIRRAVQDLAETQREDGGWGQLADLSSDAYATGSALVTLQEAEGLATDAPAYQKGLAYLVSSQLEDGSWHVKTRSKPIQAFFESGYPHDNDQFISIAAASWATTALALSLK
jgi:hypothetical protein